MSVRRAHERDGSQAERAPEQMAQGGQTDDQDDERGDDHGVVIDRPEVFKPGVTRRG